MMTLNSSNKYNEIYYNNLNPENRPLISKTDIKGNIIFTNNIFRKVSGYKKEELIGRNHNIIRHPDMPKSIFKELWETILSGKKWEGAIKNRTKDGKIYWVYAEIYPIIENENIIGFISSQKFLKSNLKKLYEEKYKKLKIKEFITN